MNNKYKLRDDKKIKNLIFQIDEIQKNYVSNNKVIKSFYTIKENYEKTKKINFEDFMNSFYHLKKLSLKNFINSQISKKLLQNINNTLLTIFQKKIDTFNLVITKFINESNTNLKNILDLLNNSD